MDIFKGWPGRLWGLAFLAGDGASILSWATGAGMSVLQDFAPTVYTFVIIFCTGGLILLSWPKIDAWRNRKATRFRQLAVLLEPYAFGKRNDVPGIRELHFALAELGIDYPVEGVDPEVRRLVSADLWAASRTGNLKHARTSWERRGKMPGNN